MPSATVSDPPDPTHSSQVIHVDFGRGRRVEDAVRRPPSPETPGTDTVARLFSAREVAEILKLRRGRLASWERMGIVAPSARVGHRRAYTFADLLAARTTRRLVDAGVSLRAIRRAVESLRTTEPGMARPVTDARLGAEGHQLVARHDGARFDPVTGQRLLDFELSSLREDVVRALRPQPSKRQRDAYAHYLEGLRLDEEETTRDRAEQAYRKAIDLDPRLATALTNLGNLRLVAGDRAEAESMYRRAIAADPSQAEAPYNLAYLLVERGVHHEAVPLFERALSLRPDFAEAHFNLAMALTEIGRKEQARAHWQRYLALDPQGPWSNVARQHLRDDPTE